MPIYEYKCYACSRVLEDVRLMDERDNIALCPKCACVMKRMPSCGAPITDTRFWYTGKYDPRLGYIEGRKDFWKKAEAKGLHEAGTRDYAVTTTLEDRMKNIPEPIKD